MTVVDTSGPAWMPSRYSAPLSEDFPSDGDWLLRLIELVWTLPNGQRLVLDDWQKWLIRHALEVYPEGHPRAGELRYRQYVVSVGRQNGKSLLGAIFGLYGLVRASGQLVIGIASSAEQARIIYKRLTTTINASPKLRKRFKRLTDTRGLQSNTNSTYEIKASKSAAVQGLDLAAGLVDELHLLVKELWSDMVNGTRAQRNGLVAGFTTAGDDTSELLLQLYGHMDNPPSERFGFTVWEAEEAAVPEGDDDALRREVIRANPAVACGRVDLDTVMSDIAGQPEVDVIRYTLNRFVQSSSGFMRLSVWLGAVGDLADSPSGVIFTVDRTPGWEHASIVASWRTPDGKVFTDVVASVARPTLPKLVALCMALWAHNPALYVADSYMLKGLVEELKKRGLPARTASLGDVISASALFYRKTKLKELVHTDHALMRQQIPNTIRKNVGEGYKIVRKPAAGKGETSGDADGQPIFIDTVLATVLGCYFADAHEDQGDQFF